MLANVHKLLFPCFNTNEQYTHLRQYCLCKRNQSVKSVIHLHIPPTHIHSQGSEDTWGILRFCCLHKSSLLWKAHRRVQTTLTHWEHPGSPILEQVHIVIERDGNLKCPWLLTCTVMCVCVPLIFLNEVKTQFVSIDSNPKLFCVLRCGPIPFALSR